MKIAYKTLFGLLLASAASIGLGGCSQADKLSHEDKSEAATTIEKPEEQSAALSQSPTANQLSEEERDQGFTLLFDGNTSDGWRGFNQDQFPPNWTIENSTLHMIGEANMSEAQKAQRADIIFDEQFENFILKLEWKISENGNSGIFYLGKEQQNGNQFDYIWKTAPEMQILDNDGHPDAKKGKDGNRQAGSLYDLVPAVPQNAAPVGQWNQVEIHVQNRMVKHIQNGEVVVEYTMDTPQWEAMIADSKFPGLNPNWSQVPEKGYIGLQDHSDPVWFRNIKIKRL